MATYWVTMTDRFMSGWGCAKGRIDKLVLPCDTYAEALIVERNARDRSEMRHINICTRRPWYPASRYQVDWHDRTDYDTWYQPNRPFLRQYAREANK